MMVGFPGETEEDFEDLLQFVKEQRFERMGAFAYSEEEGTYAANNYEDDVPAEVKQRRLDTLMTAQQEISNDIQQEKVGKTFRVIIDRLDGEYYVGRTEFDSPEVDPEVLIPVESLPLEPTAVDDSLQSHIALKIGRFYEVEITEASAYELIGKIH
jgi:ribosomal protein S12 methylthiotransferase